MPYMRRAREWAKLFRKGAPDYQDDHIWYEAAQQHDEPKVSVPDEATDATDGGADARSRRDIPEPTDRLSEPTDPTPPRETEDQKQERYRENGSPLHDMSGEYSLPELTLAGEPTMNDSMALHGLKHLPVRLRPTAVIAS
jgi:hypothetical protein